MDSTSKIYRVLAAPPKGHSKNVMVQGGESSVAIRLHRFAVVGKGDRIRFGTAGSKRVFVVSKEKNEPDIPLTPLFSTEDSVLLGKECFEIQIREIQSNDDMRAFEFLEQFHYKTNNTLSEEVAGTDGKAQSTSASGRRAILYASIKIGERWQPAGYVELQMPLMMCKPRHVLLNHPYSHPKRAIEWHRWDARTMKNYLNTIVRISRIVVSPELRGLGITRRIIKAAKDFSAKRWHIGGMRPIFMEISAEMLSHIDFVSSSGFKFVGKTEGNISRIVKDMEQMANAPKGEFGIMSLQRKYFRLLKDYCETMQIEFENGLEMLSRKIEQNHRNTLTTGEWAALRSIIRPPIPYYLSSLDEYSEEYLEKALTAEPPKDQPSSSTIDFSVKKTHIDIVGMSIRAAYTIPETKSTKIVMEAFGLKGDTIYSDIIQDVLVKASNGNIILIVGTSGSGKSVFLNALDPSKTLDGNLIITHKGMRKYTAGRLRPLCDDMPVFESLSEKHTPERTFIALSRVGLSEALAVIKPFWMLSRGQQYRAMMADLLLRSEEVWLLDEFCTDLDPITAKTVAHNLRKQVIATNRIAFIAAANHTHYLDALRPNRILVLRSGDQPSWLSFREYRDEFLNQAG